jgi:hypothetical protein
MAKGKSKPVKKPQPVTYADFLAVEHDQFKMHRAEDAIVPEVNYRFEVGEKVCYGALEDCVVEEVLEDGKLLHINYHDKGFTYGQPFDNGRKPRLVWWYMVDPIKTIIDTRFARPRIRTQYTQQSLDSLVHTCYWRGLIDSPDYQRGYVWTLEDKQRLVQSIFDRCDIGKFVFLEHPYPEHRLEVIDGKQRLRAIMDFLEGRFEFKGANWFQLSHDDKNAFFDIMVQIAQLQADKIKKSDVLWLFLSLNAAGVPQTDEHIEHARSLYQQALQDEAK